MGTRDPRRTEIPPGTLDMLILKTLSRSPMHGYGIAEHIHQMSEDVLAVKELIQGWVSAEWGQSENNRRARYYRLTAAGRKQLERELSEFNRVIRAISRVIQTV